MQRESQQLQETGCSLERISQVAERSARLVEGISRSTNDQVVGSSYVTTAWGRDYSDVSPLKGIVFGGGSTHTLDVSVDVSRSVPVGTRCAR